jgi:hypothetical protein
MNDATNIASVMSFSENIADAEPPKPLPVGTYRASVKMATQGPSKSSGKRTLTLTLHVTPDQYPADYSEDGDPEGATLMYYVSCEDTMQGRYNTRRICEVFGVPMAREINPMDFMSRECYVKVIHDPYEGRMQAKPDRGGLSAL